MSLSFLVFVFFETFFQIAQRLKTMAFVFANPALVNLVQRHRIQIMQLLASAPDDRHQVRVFQQNKGLVTACRVMSRCSHSSDNVWPLLRCKRSSSFRRLASANAL